jgi:thiamine kinase-like enzyme
LPHLWERYWKPRTGALRQVALTHGDAYLANFLCPNAGISEPVCLIDWQSPETFLAASDLANLLVTFLTSDQRKQIGEEQLLRRYYAAFSVARPGSYGLQDLLNDYRLAIIDWLLLPLQDRRDGSRKEYWWWKMQCLLDAFRDWRCEELLAPLTVLT